MRSIALVLASGALASAASALDLAYTTRSGKVRVVHNSSIPVEYSQTLPNNGGVGVGPQNAYASNVAVASFEAGIPTPGTLGTKVFTFHSYATGYNAAYGDADITSTGYTFQNYFDQNQMGDVYYRLQYRVVAKPDPNTTVGGLISLNGTQIVNGGLDGIYEGVVDGVFEHRPSIYSAPEPLTLRHDSGCYAAYAFATFSSIEMWSTLTISDSPQAVPEPASMAALGLGAIGILKRRKKA